MQGFPITYAVNGRQYLAVPVGTGGGQWVTTIPAELTPEKKIAPGGNAIFVFALPETRRRMRRPAAEVSRMLSELATADRSAAAVFCVNFVGSLQRGPHRNTIVVGLATLTVWPVGVSLPVV